MYFLDRRTAPVDISIGRNLATIVPFLGVFYAVIIMLALLYVYFATRTNKKRSRRIIVPKDSESEDDLSSDVSREEVVVVSEERDEAGDESGLIDQQLSSREQLGRPYPFLSPIQRPMTPSQEKLRQRVIALADEKFEEVSLHEGDGIHGEPNIEAVSSLQNRGKSIEARGAEV